MKRWIELIIIAVALTVMTACGNDEDSIVGKWIYVNEDREALFEFTEGGQVLMNGENQGSYVCSGNNILLLDDKASKKGTYEISGDTLRITIDGEVSELTKAEKEVGDQFAGTEQGRSKTEEDSSTEPEYESIDLRDMLLTWMKDGMRWTEMDLSSERSRESMDMQTLGAISQALSTAVATTQVTGMGTFEFKSTGLTGDSRKVNDEMIKVLGSGTSDLKSANAASARIYCIFDASNNTIMTYASADGGMNAVLLDETMTGFEEDLSKDPEGRALVVSNS